jgi:hypothetical protein
MTPSEYARLYWHAHNVHLECKRDKHYDLPTIRDLEYAAYELAKCPVASIRKAAARNLPVVVVAR